MGGWAANTAVVRAGTARLLLAALALGLFHCAPPGLHPPDPLTPAEDARVRLDERLRRAEGFLLHAQQILAGRTSGDYGRQLDFARDEASKAIQIVPFAGPVHNLLGIISIYRNDLDGAEQSFSIARGFDAEEPTYALNLAEVEVYRGNLEAAQRWIDEARRLQVDAGQIELIEALARWRAGRPDAARALVQGVLERQPQVARTWNGASAIASFEDFARHCCELPFCGPHLPMACEAAQATPER